MDIRELLRKETGNPALRLPDPNPDRPDQWRRMTCPFCKGHKGKKPNGAVNYHYDRYMCFRCGAALKGSGARKGRYPESCTRDNQARVRSQELFTRFSAVMMSAVRYVRRQVGVWQKEEFLWPENLTPVAMEFIWNYADGDLLGLNDAGMFEHWEIDSGGDEEKLKRYVGAALKGDLLNYATAEIRKAQTQGIAQAPLLDDGEPWEVVQADPVTNVTGSLSELSWFTDWKHSAVRHRTPDEHAEPRVYNGYDETDRPVGHDNLNFAWLYVAFANNESVKFTSWGRDIVRCDLMRNGLGPFKGHCEYCDASLREHRDLTDEQWLRQYGGESFWWRMEGQKTPTEDELFGTRADRLMLAA
jgi:hypothetical protein